ncbi:transposase [Desulfonatronovibrio magnus]|uniref:transposase n=1 Tax=Desulfonatronovibrio magnus TaxID=698827 RepID=UPI0005EB4897|nr:transposase [Desulfonatronovibrio magnus]
MKLNTYEHLIKSHNSAKKFLLKFCWKNHQRYCPRCSCRKVYSLESGRRRCSKCGYTFHDFSRRFLNFARLSPRQWLRFIKLFELEVDPEMMSSQLNLSYNSIRKTLNISRLSLLAGSLDGPLIIRNFNLVSLLRGESSPAIPSPVLGILPLQDKVYIDFLWDIDLETLLHFKLNFHLQTRHMGRIVYTAPYKKYLSLVAWDDGLMARHKKGKLSDKLPIETDRWFWAYSKPKLERFRTVNPLRFLLYLKELEFRFNHRTLDMFPVLCAHLCEFVPDLE